MHMYTHTHVQKVAAGMVPTCFYQSEVNEAVKRIKWILTYSAANALIISDNTEHTRHTVDEVTSQSVTAELCLSECVSFINERKHRTHAYTQSHIHTCVD